MADRRGKKNGMNKGVSRFFAAAAIMALTLPMAACGTSDSNGSGDVSAGSDSSEFKDPTSYDVSGIKKDEAVAALLPQSVTEDGKLTVGMDTSSAPAEYLASDGKTPIGYDVDLTNAIAAVLGLQPQIVPSMFDSIIAGVGAKYDVGISAFTVTADREQSVDFVTYFQSGMAFLVRTGNPTNVNPDDLCGRKVAVGTGGAQEAEVTKISEQCVADGKKPVDMGSYKRATDVTTAVITGKDEALYTDSSMAGYVVQQTGGQLERVGKDYSIAPEGIAVRKGDSATCEALQKAVQKLIDDGTYKKILDNWGVYESGAIKQSQINPTVA